MVIDKGSRTFLIECIIFQDHTFEIAINDITQQEQESRLKRQLTQNIAHELKIPGQQYPADIWRPFFPPKWTIAGKKCLWSVVTHNPND